MSPSRPSKKTLRRRLRLRQLELLAALERAPTLSAAAREVNLSQPAASKLLNSIAADLGMTLFERAGRTLRPTAAGQTLLRRAASLIGELDRTQGELEAIDKGLFGSAALGSGVGPCYVLVPRALKLLLADAPDISITMREGPMKELTDKLSEGRIDVMVGRLENALTNRDLIVEELYDPQMTVVCGPRHPLANRRKIDWADVVRQDWILSEVGTPMRNGMETLFRRLRHRPERCFVESSSIQTNVALLSQRNILWALSADIAAYFSSLGVLRILDLPVMSGPSPWVMAYLRHRSLSPAAQRLTECLRLAARDIVSAPRGASRRRASRIDFLKRHRR